MKKLFFIVLFFIAIFSIHSQKETNNWCFGNNAGINFSTKDITPILNSRMLAPAGCTSISDADGNLLMYSNGFTVWNKNHNIIEGAIQLNGNKDATQTSIIIPKPNSSNIYYIFTLVQEEISSLLGITTSGLYLSTVDFNENNGLGKLTKAKEKILDYYPTEKITAVHHKNGNSIWLITYGKQNESDEK